MPTIGHLYPDAYDKLKNCKNLENLREFCKRILFIYLAYDNYEKLLKDVPDPLKREDFTFACTTLDDVMYADECERYALAFD